MNDMQILAYMMLGAFIATIFLVFTRLMSKMTSERMKKKLGNFRIVKVTNGINNPHECYEVEMHTGFLEWEPIKAFKTLSEAQEYVDSTHTKREIVE